MKIDIEKYFLAEEISKNCEKCNDKELLEKDLIDICNNGQSNNFNILNAKLSLDETKNDLKRKVGRIFSDGIENISDIWCLKSASLSIIRRYILIKDIDF